MDLTLKAVIHHGPHDDVGVGIHHVVDHLRGGGHVFEGHVAAAADVDHAAPGPVDPRRFQQRAGHGGLGGLRGPRAA